MNTRPVLIDSTWWETEHVAVVWSPPHPKRTTAGSLLRHFTARAEACQVLYSVFQVLDLSPKLLSVFAFGRCEAILQVLEAGLFHVLVDLRLADVLALFDLVDV